MPKRPRLKGEDLYHHIYNRGNDRHPIFKANTDYLRYLDALFKYAGKYKIEVIAYALLEWHIHLFIHDLKSKLAQFMNALHGWYAQIYNKLYGRIGHVFEARFKSKVVDANNYGLWLSRYIHIQPMTAKIVSDPKDYPWTSYRVYIGLEKNPILKTETILSQFGKSQSGRIAAYKQFVENNENDGPVDWTKVMASSQPIVGDDEFIVRVKARVNNRIEDNNKFDDPIRFISNYLKVPTNILMNPCGQQERNLRRKAITVLGHKYGLGVRDIARLFNMAPSSVFVILANGKE